MCVPQKCDISFNKTQCHWFNEPCKDRYRPATKAPYVHILYKNCVCKKFTHLMWNESPRWLATICSYSSFRYCTIRSIWSCRLSRNNTASSLVTPFMSMSFTWFKYIFHGMVTIRTTLAQFPSSRNTFLTWKPVIVPPSVFLVDVTDKHWPYHWTKMVGGNRSPPDLNSRGILV
jgi:hypothetical protein